MVDKKYIESENVHLIVGDSISDIIEEVIKYIRPKSQDFYRGELRRDLGQYNVSIIDRHAGMGNYYRVCMEGFEDLKFNEAKIRDYALDLLTIQSQQLNLDY